MKKRDIVTYNSIILGLFLSMPMITKLITALISFNGNIVVCVGLLLCVSLVLNSRRIFTVHFLVINICVFTAFLLSFLVNNDQVSYTTSYFWDFILYGMCAMLFCSPKTNDAIVLKTITVAYVLFTLLTAFVYIPRAQSAVYDVTSMEKSYTMVIGISAAFFSWKYFDKISKILILLAVFISAYYLLFLSDCRGAVLALFVLIAITMLKRSKHKKLWLLTLCVGAVFVLWGWNSLLDVLLKSDSSIRWIARFRTSTNITSGRNELSAKAWNMILENLLGSGIGNFENSTNGQYTHNLFLQLFCEFGFVIGGIISVYIVYYVTNSLLRRNGNDFESFLICQFLPRLLLSSVYWVNSFFWVFFYIQITKRSTQNQNEVDRLCQRS